MKPPDCMHQPLTPYFIQFAMSVTGKISFMYALEQVFLQMRGGLMEVLMVFENLAGARHRETLKFPTRNRIETIRRLARHLADRGDVEHMNKLRLRVEEHSTLKDDPALRRLLVSEFKFHREDDGL